MLRVKEIAETQVTGRLAQSRIIALGTFDSAVPAVAGSGLIRGDLLRARSFERIEWLSRDAQRAFR